MIECEYMHDSPSKVLNQVTCLFKSDQRKKLLLLIQSPLEESYQLARAIFKVAEETVVNAKKCVDISISSIAMSIAARFCKEDPLLGVFLGLYLSVSKYRSC